jgi:glycosyltransferase involved in cell wall biosynthesis
MSGGAARIVGINSEVSKKCHVFHFALVPSEYVYIPKIILLRRILSRNSRPRVPLRSTISRINEKYTQFTFGNMVLLAVGRLASRHDLPEFVPPLLDHASLQVAAREIEQSDLVQVETPWPFDWVVRRTPRNKPVVLDEHDIVYRLYERALTERVLRTIREKEQRAVEKADAIFVVSEDDQKALCEEYGIDGHKIHAVPHGIDSSRVKPPSEPKRADTKAKFGFSNKTVVLFTGSAHFPNIVAVEAIHEMAKEVKDENIVFVVAGSVGDRVRRCQMPNVHYTGYVNDIEPYFWMADIGINPVTLGTGTNTKMIEYLANGLPVVTTIFGSRGIRLENGRHAIISEMGEFADNIIELAGDKQTRERLGGEGRRLVECHYDWKVIARKVLGVYGALVANRSGPERAKF